MSRLRMIGLSAALLLATGGIARAFVALDHLKCYKIKDSAAKAVYTADLVSVSSSFPDETGCKIKVPAKLVCDPARKTITSAPPPPGAPPGRPVFEDLACYKLKCPKSAFQVPVTDQFGSRTMTVKAPSVLCAPYNVD